MGRPSGHAAAPSDELTGVRPCDLRHARHTAGATALVLACFALAACDAGSALPGSSDDDPSTQRRVPTTPGRAGRGRHRATSTGAQTDVPVDQTIEIAVADGTLTKVSVTVRGRRPPGRDLCRQQGLVRHRRPRARHDVLHADAWPRATTGETVRADLAVHDRAADPRRAGLPVGGPADRRGPSESVCPWSSTSIDPVTDKAAFEHHMKVTTTPAQPGSLALARRQRRALPPGRPTGSRAPDG